MPTLTATLNLDTATAIAQWTTAKQKAAALSGKIQAVQATLGGLTVTGAPGGAGLLSFTVDHAQTDVTLNDLVAAATDFRDALIAFQNTVGTLGVTVTNVA